MISGVKMGSWSLLLLWLFPARCGREMPDAAGGRINVFSVACVVVDFTASWCGPCRVMAPILADIAKKMRDVIFLKVDVDELRTVAEEWEIEAMPTFIFLKEGKLVDKLVGVHKEELLAKTMGYAATMPSA